MKILRTPDERFEVLTNWSYEPHYVELDDKIRIHYVDEGPKDGELILLMHGEPTWSYLYRHMIPPLLDAGFRCVAPDLVGFGRSDKLSEISDYTFGRQVKWMTEWMIKVDLQDITLFCQDWGSLIGMRMAAENQERFKRLMLSNGGLSTGDGPVSEFFMKWRHISSSRPMFDWEPFMQNATDRTLTEEDIKGYGAPFPDPSYMMGPRAMPSQVPISPDDPEHDANVAAIEVYKKWTKPFLTAFGTHDLFTKGGQRVWQKMVPGAQGQKHRRVKNANHFIQEDKGPELADILIEFIKDNP